MFGLSFSIRTYAEIFGAAAILVGFLWFTHHERDIGRQEVLAADAKVVQLQEQLNAQKDLDAQALVNTATAVFQNTLNQRVPAPKPVRLCLDALSGGAAGTDGGATGGPDDLTDVQVTVERIGASTGFDVGTLTEHYLDEADGQIIALQAYVATCQKEGFCKATVPPTPEEQAALDQGPSQTLPEVPTSNATPLRAAAPQTP
jgi:hypothetical protein